MEFDVISQIVSQVGFPIFVAVYTLVRLEKNIKANTEVLQMLAVKFDSEKTKGA